MHGQTHIKLIEFYVAYFKRMTCIKYQTYLYGEM